VLYFHSVRVLEIVNFTKSHPECSTMKSRHDWPGTAK
jgi:hypothetical protein